MEVRKHETWFLTDDCRPDSLGTIVDDSESVGRLQRQTKDRNCGHGAK